MKNRILAGIVTALLVSSMFQITLNITLTPAVFSSGSMAYKEIWQVVNVTNTHGSMNTSGNINIAVNNRTGINIAWSTNITEYFKNFTYWNALGYKRYKDWMNGTTTLPYHWGEMDWYVSEGSLTPITWDEIKYWWDMYKDSGGGVNYSTFMGNTYMADFNFTDPTNDPDIIRLNQTHIGVPWVGNNITIKNLVVPANTTVYLVLKIVITIPGVYTFNITSPNPLLQIPPSYWRTGGAATILVPDEYDKIQDAIDYAKSGDTIVVFGGVYDEQLVITKSLTLQGMGNDTIIKPSSAAKLTQVFTGLFWYGTPNTKQIAGIIVANVLDGGNVTIKNLKVNESSVVTKPVGADYLAGIFYRETGGKIEMVNIVGTGAWSGGDRAYGIYLSAATNTVSVEITGSTITNFDKNGIEAHGNKLTFNIHHNTITGRGSISDEVQNGVNIGRDATGMVNYNIIRNLEYGPKTWWAAAIMFYHYVLPAGVSASVQGNTITDCQIGIIFKNANSWAEGNTVSGGTVGLLGIGTEPNLAGAYKASFVNNTVSGVSDYTGYENSAIDAQTFNAGVSLTVTIRDNTLTGGGSTLADGVYIDGSAGSVTATISGNIISGWYHGINLVSSVTNANITGNTIKNNTGTGSGIHIEAAINVTNIHINYNNIFSNKGTGTYGISNNGIGTLDARFNWWGNETGPHHDILNPSGSGDNVSDNVKFEPWLIQRYPPAAQVSVVYINPSLIKFWTPAYGRTFVVHVKTNVTLLAGFQFKLVWNGTLLKLTGVTYYAPWTPYFKAYENITTNSYALALSGYNTSAHYPFTGSTTLASLNFKTTFDPIFPNNATCSLSLEDVVLSDPKAKPIPFLKYPGTYQCYATKPKVALSPKEMVVKKVPSQFDIKINITNIINLNSFKFNITYNPTLIQAQTIKIEPFFNASYFVAEQRINNEIGFVSIRVNSITPAANGSAVLATITFKVVSSVIWPNPPLSCNFTFSSSNLASIGNVSLQHDAIGAGYTYQPVKGDLNGDGTVGLYDLVRTALAFGSRSGSPNWDLAADMIRDGVINILDIIVVASNYGSTG